MFLLSQGETGLLETYHNKDLQYFSGVRSDYLSELDEDSSAWILEIGCGFGNTGAKALSEGKCGHYCAVELCEAAAEKAEQQISEVVCGNIEDIDLPWPDQTFDALILSEILEHLVDPWAVLRKARRLMKPYAAVFASTPNISYYRVVLMLLKGRWDLTDRGVMDRTHLRWFTPQSFREMFESCGYCVRSVRPKAKLSLKAKIASVILGKRFEHLFWYQIDLRASC